ncbi:MAG TPA: dual specificity protein phosphatase 23 [Candidatus Latescibacteria bacterium]|nr:protein phosphatase [Gemmatimonadota bacterium]HJN26780.1 dual specificity protein phosphatase 23 [Candidatus Latescibacterota bacterium]
MMLFNFSWVIDGSLAACGHPGGSPYAGALEADLQIIRSQGIGLVVTLTETPLDPQALEKAGLRGIHLPVPDMTPPSLEAIDLFIDAADVAMQENLATLVHCRAGLGRTGTVVACYLVRAGLTGDEAIHQIRQLRPGSIETLEQEATVQDFATRCGAEQQKA